MSIFAFIILMMCVCLVSCRNTESGGRQRRDVGDEKSCKSIEKVPVFSELPPPVNGAKGRDASIQTNHKNTWRERMLLFLLFLFFLTRVAQKFFVIT